MFYPQPGEVKTGRAAFETHLSKSTLSTMFVLILGRGGETAGDRELTGTARRFASPLNGSQPLTCLHLILAAAAAPLPPPGPTTGVLLGGLHVTRSPVHSQQSAVASEAICTWGHNKNFSFLLCPPHEGGNDCLLPTERQLKCP